MMQCCLCGGGGGVTGALAGDGSDYSLLMGRESKGWRQSEYSRSHKHLHTRPPSLTLFSIPSHVFIPVGIKEQHQQAAYCILKSTYLLKQATLLLPSNLLWSL